MTQVVYLGDEVSAAGFRLAGVLTVVPAPGEAAAALVAASAHAELVLVSADIAADIPATTLQAARARLMPLTLVVPDLLGATAMPDLATRLRGRLGLTS